MKPVVVHLTRALLAVHGRLDIRVTLDGRDITRDCYAADARRGLALCWQRGPTGEIVVDDRPVREARRGHVEIAALVQPWVHTHQDPAAHAH